MGLRGDPGVHARGLEGALSNAADGDESCVDIHAPKTDRIGRLQPWKA